MLAQQIAENFSVTPQISVADVADIAQAGFGQVICNRPDNEEPGQPAAADIAKACAAHGIAFHHLPFQGNLPPKLVEDFRALMDKSSSPTLAYCRSGQRCVLLWHNAMGTDT